MFELSVNEILQLLIGKLERTKAQLPTVNIQQLDMEKIADQVEKMQRDLFSKSKLHLCEGKNWMNITNIDYQKMTDEQMKEKEKVNLQLVANIFELENEKKVLLQTVKELELEIEKQKGQHKQEDMKAKQESEITPKEERQCARYA